MTDKKRSSQKQIETFIMREFKEFKKALNSEDDLNILKFHLVFENMLERIIVSVLKRGDRLIDKGNLSFAQKLMIVHSFDIISDSYIQALRQLNSLRNKLSHVKETVITLENVDLIGHPLGKAYTNIQRKYKNDYLFKVVWDTMFLIHKGLVRQIAIIEFGDDKIEDYITKKKSKQITKASRGTRE